jgi:putative transposase
VLAGAAQAWKGLDRYFSFYNGRRSHLSLDERTPDQVDFELQPAQLAA